MTTIPIESPSPTVTHYQQAAARAFAALDELEAIIPNFEAPHPSTAKFVRAHQVLPLQFLATAISAVEQEVQLQRVEKLDVAAGRDALQFIEAYNAVVDRGEAFFRKLRFTLNSKKATPMFQALQIYDIAQGLARDPGSAGIGAHVANMKRDLGRSGLKRKAAAPADPANPATQERKAS